MSAIGGKADMSPTSQNVRFAESGEVLMQRISGCLLRVIRQLRRLRLSPKEKPRDIAGDFAISQLITLSEPDR